MDGLPITIELTSADWLRLAIVIKVMRDEARTVPGAQILADLGLKILAQVSPERHAHALADHNASSSMGSSGDTERVGD